MKKIVIMGAGPAGLTAAYQLLKNKDYKVTIIEESSTVGGISKTVEYKNNKMDLGGHRFFTKNKEIKDLWNELMPIEKAEGEIEKRKNIFLIRNRVSRIYYLKKFFDYPINIATTIKNLKITTTILCGLSYIKSVFFKKKETNLENFYINRFGFRLYSMFFKDYTKKLWGRDAKDIDSSWGSQRVKGISIIKVLKNSLLKIIKVKEKNVETSLIDSFYYPKYGPGQLWNVMKEKIESKNGIILLNSKVISIHKKGKKIDYIEYVNEGKKHRIDADYFISSISLKDLINNMNGVSKDVSLIADNLPYRSFVTIGIILKKLVLEDKTHSGNKLIPDTWIYVQEPNIKMGRIQVFNNWSPYLVADENTISLGLEYFCDEEDDFYNASDEELKDFAIGELEKMKIADRKDIKYYHVERVKKAYPAYFDSYKDIDKIIDYLNRIVNLYCIGRNGQHRYNNMDHSMLTGIYAANSIISKSVNKQNIWNINVEDEYLEDNNV